MTEIQDRCKCNPTTCSAPTPLAFKKQASWLARRSRSPYVKYSEPETTAIASGFFRVRSVTNWGTDTHRSLAVGATAPVSLYRLGSLFTEHSRRQVENRGPGTASAWCGVQIVS